MMSWPSPITWRSLSTALRVKLILDPLGPPKFIRSRETKKFLIKVWLTLGSITITISTFKFLIAAING